MKNAKETTGILCTAAVIMLSASTFGAACNVNMTSNQQIIDGYGFSSAWCGTLSSAKNNALYNTLGMSLLRIRIDQNNNWTDEINNANAAHAAGAKVFGCPWYIPNAFRSGNTIPSSQYVNYCNWLRDAANAMNLDFVCLKNEPDGSSTDGNLNGTQFRDILNAGGSNIGRPLGIADAVNFNDSLTDPTLNDSSAVNKISIVTGHLYGGGLYTHQNALNKGKRVWMTEYYVNGINDINACMTIAKQISDCMNNRFSAYVWWWVNDTDLNVNLVNQSGVINKNGYTIGQFAKWVRPGSTKVSADYNPSSNVYVTAYRVNGGTVIVAVNTGTSSVSQQFIIQNGNAGTLRGYRTSSSQNMSDIGSFTVSSGSFTASLPGQTVTTFVQTGGSGGPIADGTYRIIARHSGKALDAYNNQTANGTQIIQWAYGGGNNQRWTVANRGNNQYSIIGVQSGRAIDVNNSGTANGTKVQLWDYAGGNNQKYTFTATSGGYYRVTPVHATGACLDVSGISTADGALVHLWQWLNGNNQQWAFQAP